MLPMDNAASPPATLLVVDDTPDSLRFLMTALEAARMTVLVAIDGSAALDLLQHVTPDLILMDAVMPNLDGFETTRRIKANPKLAHVPVIFMTGLTETEHVVRGLAAGGVDYVHKPIVIDELLARIRAHLATARMAQGGQLALDTSGRPAFAIDSAGVPRWLTPVASEILERRFPTWSATSGALPEELAGPLERLQASAPEPGATVSIAVGDGMLEAAYLRRTATDEWLFRLTDRQAGREEELLAEQLGLTQREAEVLLWISRGKQNREVSEILQISPRTVNKHLEQIFQKMGVENRASATAIAVTMLVQ